MRDTLRPLGVTVLGAAFAVPLYVVLANAFKPGADIAPH
ncbi:carbohydrate ABC transporter permease, partial [Streptomyces phyllanthi]|nr:carbohydrate ABC transporter permease [Streptomyces phyllanthi]